MYVPVAAVRNRWESEWTWRGSTIGPLRVMPFTRLGPINLIASPKILLTRREEALL